MAEPKLQTLSDAISTTGLDSIFEDVATDDVSRKTGAAAMSSETVDVSATDANSFEDKYVLVSEAAALLKKSERTIQRWASAKKIRHKTDESGRMWVAVPSTADIKISYADSDVSEPVLSAGVDQLSSLVAKLADDLMQAKDQLSVASGQIGYLKAHLEEREKDLEERDEKIKLLTDSQRQSGWWTRFSAWFLGKS